MSREIKMLQDSDGYCDPQAKAEENNAHGYFNIQNFLITQLEENNFGCIRKDNVVANLLTLP